MATLRVRKAGATVDVAGGDAPTLSELYRARYLDLVRLAAQLVDDQATAEDIVQDVFAALQMRRQHLDDPVRYLRAAVVNRSRSVLRRRRTARLLIPPRERHAGPADESSLQRDERAAMLSAIARLPQRQRELVVLRYYEDLDIREMAALVGITPGTASSSLSRALATLSKLIEQTSGEADARQR